MLARIAAIALNTYREAVRARVLFGLLGLALATTAYSLVVATLSLHQEQRVVSDVGSASISLYAVVVAIVLGATSLHRELELKTIFPILTRRLRRHEYLVAKYLGTLLTLAVFVAIDGSMVLAIVAGEGGQSLAWIGGVALAFAWALGAALWWFKRARVYIVIPWAILLYIAMALLAGGHAADERRLVVASAVLTLSEVAIVAAIATFFSSFSSPFLTALLTFLVFLVGRSADTLANLPAHVFGEPVHRAGGLLARVFPNLHFYVPPRVLLLGQVPDAPVWSFVALGAAHALFYATLILTLSALIFRKRDFQ